VGAAGRDGKTLTRLEKTGRSQAREGRRKELRWSHSKLGWLGPEGRPHYLYASGGS